MKGIDLLFRNFELFLSVLKVIFFFYVFESNKSMLENV